MDDPISRGLPFELGDIWHHIEVHPEEGTETLFKLLPADFEDLKLNDAINTYHHDLRLPELDCVNGDVGEQLRGVDSDAVSFVAALEGHETESNDANTDVWTINFDREEAGDFTRLHCWESFEKKAVPNAERTPYLSEAGPNAFDAALTQFEKGSTRTGVLPQDVMLRALCNLALGRSSLFFQWDAAKNVFACSLPDTPISGYSSTASESLLKGMMHLGTTYRTLVDYASSDVPFSPSHTAIIAFKGCIRTLLDAIERNVTQRTSGIRSILRLQRVTTVVHHLLELMSKLMDSIKDYATDEAVISALSDRVHYIVSAQHSFSDIPKLILARTSQPWLDRLCTDLGLKQDSVQQSVYRPEDDMEDVKDTSSISIAPQPQKIRSLPSFVDENDRALIMETRESLQTLREHVPNYGLDTQILSDVSLGDLNGIGHATLLFSNEGRSTLMEDGSAWTDDDAQHQRLAFLDAQMSQLPTHHEQHQDRLEMIIEQTLDTDHSVTAHATFCGNLEYNPIEQMRPVIKAHRKLISKALLRHLFLHLKLLDHLHLQRQYHLFGNGEFVSRISTALFSTETQSAERKRGVVPTGETMGLRLGAREGQRWPPASSELRLTLMNVLTETHGKEKSGQSPSVKKVLPGGLSFSIRELPDQDIERVLDPSSIYALDFLRLQYSPPPCIDAILTPMAMQSYDTVFRFLLRLLRVLDITTKMQTAVARSRPSYGWRRSKQSTEMRTKARFASEAHHLVSVLVSHLIQVGIEAPWRVFSSTLARIEKALHDESHDNEDDNSLVGLDSLRKLHDDFLQNVRNKLFLRQKHERIRSAIEAVFTAILSCAAALEQEKTDDLAVTLKTFERSISDLLALLRTALDKPPKSSSMTDSLESEVEAMRMLLVRLDWNDIYSSNS
ncbi:hypothetical protein LTR37_002925 [Vermiconidia calcicola]|uniref:Uncharacterized protein n=1 Tax=Vermiconidia calcicola TaxID=1690605 RepID=A0ACC3NRQ9_9PEZI|nr:hypothetical protein LTR37_002925 [Vermiconidia calcicola]